jgi:hypothetical protein
VQWTPPKMAALLRHLTASALNGVEVPHFHNGELVHLAPL